MLILITGGFGSVGLSVIHELLRRGHRVRVMELDSKKTRKYAKQFGNQIEINWGNLLNPPSIKNAVKDVDVVLHFAGIVPPLTEDNGELCFKVNVQGTRNLIKEIKEQSNPPPLLFTSSVSVMGPTQSKTPPVNPYDTPNPTNNYTRAKVQVEQDLKEAGIKYCVCRFAAVLSTHMSADPALVKNAFDIPLMARVEMVLDLDLAVAVSNAAELLGSGDSLNGKILNIGGGKEKGFQRYGHELTQSIFEAMGIGRLNEKCYTTKEYFLDWLDTEESQRLLQFQNHTYEELLILLTKPYNKFKPFFKLFSPLIRKYFEAQSPVI